MTTILSNSEIEAVNLCSQAGWLPIETGERGNPKRAVKYILELAERIKNERLDMILENVINIKKS